MNKEKLLSSCRRIAALSCAVLVAFFSLGCPSVSAVQIDPQIVDLPVATDLNSSVPVTEVAIIGMKDVNNQLFMRTTNQGVCGFIYGSNPVYAAFCSVSIFSANTCGVGYAGTSYARYCNSVNQDNALFDYDLYYWTVPLDIFNGVVFDIEPFNDLESGMLAAYEHLNGSPLQSLVTVPAGWVAYFKTSGGSASFFCRQNELSSATNSTPWPNSQQFYSYSSTLPTSNTTFPISGSLKIPWTVGTPKNTWGQSKSSEASVSSVPSSQYVVVYNQLQNEVVSFDPYQYLPNGTIYVNSAGISDVHLYPLSLESSYVDGQFNQESGSNDDFSDGLVGEIDEDGNITYVDGNGNVVTPGTGGQNYLPEDITAQGFLNQVVDLLKGLVEGVGNLFGTAYDAIVSLVSLASPFVSKLAALYSWLPSPVFSALTSAMVLAITIGVLKSFL